MLAAADAPHLPTEKLRKKREIEETKENRDRNPNKPKKLLAMPWQSLSSLEAPTSLSTILSLRSDHLVHHPLKSSNIQRAHLACREALIPKRGVHQGQWAAGVDQFVDFP